MLSLGVLARGAALSGSESAIDGGKAAARGACVSVDGAGAAGASAGAASGVASGAASGAAGAVDSKLGEARVKKATYARRVAARRVVAHLPRGIKHEGCGGVEGMPRGIKRGGRRSGAGRERGSLEVVHFNPRSVVKVEESRGRGRDVGDMGSSLKAEKHGEDCAADRAEDFTQGVRAGHDRREGIDEPEVYIPRTTKGGGGG